MISIIVAVAKDGAIGKGGKMPWRIPGEQQQFKELTTGHVVIMGRKSFEEIGHPLPDRKNIVVSKTKVFSGENLITAKSLEEALSLAGEEEIFIAGGAELFQKALPLADRIYITYVDLEVPDADRFFPDFPKEKYMIVELEKLGGEIPYHRFLYTKI